LHVQQAVNQPNRLIERRDGGGRDQILDQLWAVTPMSQALAWSVGGKSPGGNAGSGTWLR